MPLVPTRGLNNKAYRSYTSMPSLKVFEYKGQTIEQREDGYINLTQMCQANGKRVNNFLRMETTKAYIQELEKITNVKHTELVNITQGGGEWVKQGTYAHKMIAIRCAQWISIPFSLWCNIHIFNVVDENNLSTELKSEAKNLAGFVYLAKQTHSNYYKIGCSKNPYQRLQTLQTASPLEIKIIERIFSFDCYALEKDLHNYYSGYWIRGEWFDFTDEIVKEFYCVAYSLDKTREESNFTALLENNINDDLDTAIRDYFR